MKTTTKAGKGPPKKKGTENNPRKGWRKVLAEVDLMVKIGFLAKLIKDLFDKRFLVRLFLFFENTSE